MSKDFPVAKMQAPVNPSADGGPTWAPVSGVVEDIGAKHILSTNFGPVTIEIKAKTVEDAETARTILAIFSGAMNGQPFSTTSALQVISK